MPTAHEIDWYDTPRYYDAVFDVDTEREADFLEALHARHATGAAARSVERGRGRCLEPAAGSGRLVVELARRGWRVTGNDLSRPMLDHARGRLREAGLRATLEQGDMAELDLRGRFDLAHCLVSTFKYLPTEAAATAHLRRVAELLVPGGVYVLGFHLTDYGRTTMERERWVVDAGDERIVCRIEGAPPDRRRRRERVRSHLAVTRGGDVHRQRTEWWFRTYDADQVRRLLRRVPELELVATHTMLYDLDYEVELDEHAYDVVLVLRRAV